MSIYHDDNIIEDIIFYWLCVNMFAYGLTRYCPLKLIAKYLTHTKDLNFSRTGDVHTATVTGPPC